MAKKISVVAKDKERIQPKLSDQSQELKNTYLAILNILEDLQTEKEALAVARAKDKALLESIGNGVVATDQVGKVILINRAAKDLLKLTDTEIMGKSFIQVVSQQDIEGNNIPDKLRPISLVLNSGTSSIANNCYFVLKDGTKFPVAIVVSPVKVDGKLIGSIIVFQDITRDKEIEKYKDQQLQQKTEMETKERDFISMVSHQLLTPLALVRGYISMLISGKIGKIDKEAKRYLTESFHGGERMSKIIKSLLTMSRIESETINISKTNFDLNRLVKIIINILKQSLEHDNEISVKFFSSRHKIMVYADKQLTGEALKNVLNNAIKFGNKDTITVATSQKGNMGIVSVKDNGIGISQKELPHIFDKFYVSRNRLEAQSDSHGLGLYITKLFLKLMDGSIKVESKLKRGSTFTISLPLAKNYV